MSFQINGGLFISGHVIFWWMIQGRFSILNHFPREWQNTAQSFYNRTDSVLDDIPDSKRTLNWCLFFIWATIMVKIEMPVLNQCLIYINVLMTRWSNSNNIGITSQFQSAPVAFLSSPLSLTMINICNRNYTWYKK